MHEDISILIPVYNHADSVHKALDGILMQKTSYSYAIHCFNDSSTDQSGTVLQRYATAHPEKIKIYTSTKNFGRPKDFWQSLRPSIMGRYWCILEGDDYWTAEDKLEKQISFLDQNPDYVGCTHITEIFNFSLGKITGAHTPFAQDWNILDWFLHEVSSVYAHTSSIIWRRKKGFFLPDTFIKEPFGGDYLLSHIMLHGGGKMHNIPEVMGRYNFTGKGMWSSISDEERETWGRTQEKISYRLLPLRYKILVWIHKKLEKYPFIAYCLPGPINSPLMNKERRKRMKYFIDQLRNVIDAHYYNDYPPLTRLPRQISSSSPLPTKQQEKGTIDYDKIFEKITNHISFNPLSKAYTLLADEYSKKLFVDLCVLRLLGNKMMLDIEKRTDLWEKYFEIEHRTNRKTSIKTKMFELFLYDLNFLGYNIKLHYIPTGVHINFILHQYALTRGSAVCKVEEGDYVIDGGACFGDTALYFAHEAGPTGHVFSFEFIQENVSVFNKNIALNPHLKDTITLTQNPLWKNSSDILFIKENGPASTVSFEKPKEHDDVRTIQTCSIDDFVKHNKIKKIDFIKFDIEGAELEALQGAEETIKYFRPKLAICLYHKMQHFAEIPLYLEGLNLGYTFYIDHFTPIEWETVLFAIPNHRPKH